MEVDCPFRLVPDKSLETSRVLLLNLGARMLRGLKNTTTADEHNALMLCAKVIEKEQQLRATTIGDEHHHPVDAAPTVENGGC